MNERRFHNGRGVEVVPLVTLFGASNELPEDDELQALYDRFLLRFVVSYIDEDFRFLKMLQARPTAARTRLSLDVLQAAQAEAAAVAIPDPIYRSRRAAPRAGQDPAGLVGSALPARARHSACPRLPR
jgi:MoxR-like ATPase